MSIRRHLRQVKQKAHKKTSEKMWWPHKVGPNTRENINSLWYFFMLHSFLYILLDLNILIFLLFYLCCNIRYILLLFLLILHMIRILCHSIFLVLVFQRSFPLGSYLGNCPSLTWIGLSLLFLVVMCIVLPDMPILGLNEIFFLLYLH